MSTEPEVPQKSEFAPVDRRKFIVKIMVTKKGKPKKNPQKRNRGTSSKTKNSAHLLHREMEVNFKEVQQHKTKLEELTKSTIEELKKLHDLHKKATKLQPQSKDTKTSASKSNDNHRFELDYELTNLKMIKKILALSVPFEGKQHAPKEKVKAQKIPAASKGKKKLKTKGKEAPAVTKVLIVEDDRTTIKIITHILEQHNFKVAFATEAGEGLTKAFKEKPDLILLDIMLPGMDGFQLLTKLQATEETSRIPVIILSSLSGEKDILKGLEKGATDYILKPFSPQILFFKIKKIMSLKNERIVSNRHV
jgi:PleD family two-component response regulator